MMTWTDELPEFQPQSSPATLVLEAEPGRSRWERVDAWLRQARQRGARTWQLDCDFAQGGPWAGLRAWMEALLPHLRQAAPELILQHDYELLTVVPRLRRERTARHLTLTDSASGEERVRNFPMDRAFRIGHGLVDLLAAWHERSGDGPWVVACDAFDEAGSLVRRFFQELVRRRGQQLQLTLLLTAAPGAGEAMAHALPPGIALLQGVRLTLPAGPRPSLPPEEARRRAEALERSLGEDLIEIETHLPELMRLWEQAGNEERLRRGRTVAFGLTNHHGLYEDALRYGKLLEGDLATLEREDPEMYWVILDHFFNSYIGTQKVREALALTQELEARIRAPEKRLRLYYNLAMLHARYLPTPDLALAEDYLERGLAELERAHLPEEKKHFFHVFNRNGLAFVRHRQGRGQEAIELCRQGSERLDTSLRPEQHRLHRSVLQYNVAQVYAALGAHAQALAQYTAAIEMDPHYSEYYNERGSLLMRMGRLEEALADLRRAEALSPPYAEVRINLGQCLRRMQRMEEAFEAYGAALDLEPHRVLARIGRAQAAEALGRLEEAVADYGAALELEPAQPLVLANRAALHYEAGRLEEACSDLESALTLAPEMAELHRNHALLLADLGRTREAAEELRAYLRLAPRAEDHDEVVSSLQALLGAPASSGWRSESIVASEENR
jgi:tetratricopeptide (TPR) repeat protein